MPETRRPDLFGRLADLSEEAIQRLGDAPGADRIAGVANSLRDRLDELQKRVRGLERLEERIAALEQQVEQLSKGRGAGTSRRATKAAGAKTADAEADAEKD